MTNDGKDSLEKPKTKLTQLNNQLQPAHTISATLGPSAKQKHHIIVDTGYTGYFLAVTAPYKNKKQKQASVSNYYPTTKP